MNADIEDPRQLRREAFQNQSLQVQGRIGRISYCFNPVTSLASASIVWTIVICALVIPESEDTLVDIQEWFTRTCTWFYSCTFTMIVFFILFIYIKFGHLKLGDEKDEPEFDDFTYFAMVFTAGISSTLFYSSVSDPLNNYNSLNDGIIFWGKENKNTLAQNAINITFFHWGFHGFGTYIIPALLIGILGYKKGLPLTMRTCFYPLFGRKIFGRFGDLVDTISILCVIFGLSVSLTFGAKLLNSGIEEIAGDDRFAVGRENQIICIWVLTVVATLSVISGLHLGMKRMACYSFVAGCFLLLVVVFCNGMWFTLNLFVQSVGYYIQHFIGTGTHTAAFGQTGNVPNQTASSEWMNKNTIAYWGWWAAWGPLGNVFIARVSKGRSIRSVITYSFLLPTLFVFMVITIFGSAGINLENEAILKGITCDMYNNNARINSSMWTGMDDKLVRLSCLDTNSKKYYQILDQFDNVKHPLKIVTLISIVLWFSTSSDSASFVVDILSTNGVEYPSKEQRAFWALTEGAAATAILFFSSDHVFIFVVMFGLPFTMFLCLCCLSLWRVLKKEPNWQYDLDGNWKMDYGTVKTLDHLKKVVVTTFIPWYYLGKIAIFHGNIEKAWKRNVTFIRFSVLFNGWIILLLLQIWWQNVDNMGWALLIGFLFYVSYFRKMTRERQEIEGNIIEDMLAAVFYPLTITQMHEEILHIRGMEKNQTDAHHDNNYVNNNRYINGAFELQQHADREDVQEIDM